MKKRYSLAFTFFCFNYLMACQSTLPLPASALQVPALQAPSVQIEKPAMMCTMQYDPVCVKTMNQGVVSYQTYGNACMASHSVNPISVTKGACGTDTNQ